jgi:hypothetical protein
VTFRVSAPPSPRGRRVCKQCFQCKQDHFHHLQTAGLSHFLIFGVQCKQLSATTSQSFDRSLPLPAPTLAHLFASLPTTGDAASNLNTVEPSPAGDCAKSVALTHPTRDAESSRATGGFRSLMVACSSRDHPSRSADQTK